MEHVNSTVKHILYIAPENTVGTLNLWKKVHDQHGNLSRSITFYHSASGFEDDICLDLPLISPGSFYKNWRHKIQSGWYDRDPQSHKEGYPPEWQPANSFEANWFHFRDWLWHFKIEPALRTIHAEQFDIFHFEWGLDFYRDSRFAKKIHTLGKPIICHFHGQDMRNRGVIPDLDAITDLRLTSELDLLKLHPDIHYLFLPFDTERFTVQNKLHSPLRICHSTTNRFFKGSDLIIQTVENLAKTEHIEFILIENQSHAKALEMKASCDINIDQLTDLGGWGYGMNSVESLSMGICTLAYLNDNYEQFIPDHPFVNATPKTLDTVLRNLVASPQTILQKKLESKAWVQKYHNLFSVGNTLYEYYQQFGML